MNDCVVRTMGARREEGHGQTDDVESSVLLLVRRWPGGARG